MPAIKTKLRHQSLYLFLWQRRRRRRKKICNKFSSQNGGMITTYKSSWTFIVFVCVKVSGTDSRVVLMTSFKFSLIFFAEISTKSMISLHFFPAEQRKCRYHHHNNNYNSGSLLAGLSASSGPARQQRKRRRRRQSPMKQETCYEVVLPRFILVFLLFECSSLSLRLELLILPSRRLSTIFLCYLLVPSFTHSIKTSFSTAVCALMYTWTWVNVLESEQANQLNEYYFILSVEPKKKTTKKREEKLWRKKISVTARRTCKEWS